MRDPTSPETLTARLAALRASALPAVPAPRPSAPTSPARHVDGTVQLAERLARLRAPAASSASSSGGARVPVGFKGVDELEGTAREEDDEVEQFLRRVEEEERLGRGVAEATGTELAEDDKDDDLVEAILRSRSPPSGPPLDLPSPPSSPPLSRARRSIPALSPSLLDTLSGVEVQFFRPGLGLEAPVRSADAAVLGGAGRRGEEDEEDELMRRVREEGEVELRQGAADKEEEDAATSEWEARLAGLGGADAPSGLRGEGTRAPLGPGAAPPREGVEEVRRAVRRRERRRSGKAQGRGRSETDSEEEESSEEDSAEDEENTSE